MMRRPGQPMPLVTPVETPWGVYEVSTINVGTGDEQTVAFGPAPDYAQAEFAFGISHSAAVWYMMRQYVEREGVTFQYVTQSQL